MNGLDCHKCTDQLKVARGCNERRMLLIEGYEINKCPMKYAGEKEFGFIKAYGHYKNGLLPNAGGWLEQPADFVEAMEIIENVVERIKEPKQKELKK